MIGFAPSQEELAQAIEARGGPPGPNETLVSCSGDRDIVIKAFREATGYYAEPDLRFMTFVPPDRIRGLILVAHNFTSTGNVDLVPVGTLGQLHRDVRKTAAWWLFNLMGVRRITVRVHQQDERMMLFAARLGFGFEGVQYHYFGPGQHCSLWGLTHDDARALLLKQPPPEILLAPATETLH